MSAALVILSPAEAQRLTQRIRNVATGVRDNLVKLRNLVDEAKRSNAWQVLGFASWTAYLSDTLASEPMRLGRDERQQLVEYLSGEGMSTRAIAPIVGVSQKTVDRDVRGESNDSPAPESSVVENATASVSAAPAEEVAAPVRSAGAATVDLETGEVVDGLVVTEHTVTEKTRTVVGMDGKTYTPTERAPKRRSLVDDAYKANTELWKAVERIRTIHDDDRFTRNKADILAALQPSARLALEVLSDLFPSEERN